jgi:GNAT superfamily N-acetyltransferase
MPYDPQDTALLRRVEEASLNSWPAPRQVLLDGWVLRFASGYTRRANSVTPLDPGQDGPASLSAKIAACETLYAAQSLPALVRVRSFDPGLPLGPGPGCGHTAEGVELSEVQPGPGWLDAHARLSSPDVSARARILDTVTVPCAFAGARADAPGSPLVSVGFGAVHGGVVCLHLVATDPAFRRRGLSRRVVSALLAWAHDRAGARGASLQVAAENAGAHALYAKLGFRTELFRYQYYRQPAVPFL